MTAVHAGARLARPRASVTPKFSRSEILATALMFVFAVYFLATGITGLSMLGIPLWVTNVFNGGALILAVTISQLTRGREASDIG